MLIRWRTRRLVRGVLLFILAGYLTAFALAAIMIAVLGH